MLRRNAAENRPLGKRELNRPPTGPAWCSATGLFGVEAGLEVAVLQFLGQPVVGRGGAHRGQRSFLGGADHAVVGLSPDEFRRALDAPAVQAKADTDVDGQRPVRSAVGSPQALEPLAQFGAGRGQLAGRGSCRLGRTARLIAGEPIAQGGQVERLLGGARRRRWRGAGRCGPRRGGPGRRRARGGRGRCRTWGGRAGRGRARARRNRAWRSRGGWRRLGRRGTGRRFCSRRRWSWGLENRLGGGLGSGRLRRGLGRGGDFRGALGRRRYELDRYGRRRRRRRAVGPGHKGRQQAPVQQGGGEKRRAAVHLTRPRARPHP